MSTLSTVTHKRILRADMTLHTKMQGFQNKKIPIYILGGNHRWQAYSLLRTKYLNQQDKIKELSLNSVLAAVYWWLDLLEQSIDEMR
jgi:hypothetical protein